MVCSHFTGVVVLISIEFDEYIIESDFISYLCFDRINSHSIHGWPNFTFIPFNHLSTNLSYLELVNNLYKIFSTSISDITC